MAAEDIQNREGDSAIFEMERGNIGSVTEIVSIPNVSEIPIKMPEISIIF